MQVPQVLLAGFLEPQHLMQGSSVKRLRLHLEQIMGTLVCLILWILAMASQSSFSG